MLGRGTLSIVTTFDLRSLRIRSGEEHREAKDVELPALDLGGQRYVPVPQEVQAELAVTRASTGTVLRLRFPVRLHGPCVRCLADAVLDVPIDASEYEATSPGDADELRSPYVADDLVDLSAWARDALVLALPDQILCRPECAGLCPVCGRDLNLEPHTHEEAEADPRWAALESLRDRL
jgi:uncharacterized protein